MTLNAITVRRAGRITRSLVSFAARAAPHAMR